MVFEVKKDNGRYVTVAEGESIDIAYIKHTGLRRVDGCSEISGVTLPRLQKEPNIKVKLLVRGKSRENPPWTVREDVSQINRPTGAQHAQTWAAGGGGLATGARGA